MTAPIHPAGGRISGRAVFALLSSHHLLREVINGKEWTLDPENQCLRGLVFSSLSYDSRNVEPSTLLFCKGNFKASYLPPAIKKGVTGYVSETELETPTPIPGFIVTNVYHAMALIAQEFYGHPERDLKIVAITGTKGKTTTAYMTHAILAHATGNRCALMCSEADCLDGKTWTPSILTTPESIDMMRMMREAVDHGMKDLVLEVSSQAFKIGRVFGLTFDVGAFLNISPDHISPIEHPTFEDYFYCKRKMIAASRLFVFNATLGVKTRLIAQNAALLKKPTATFSMNPSIPATFMGSTPQTVHGKRVSTFTARPRLRTDGNATASDLAATPSIDMGTFSLKIQGDFNYENALAAVSLAIMAGVDPIDHASLQAVCDVTVPGRMQEFVSHDGIISYVDYAHNYLSLTALLTFVRQRYPHSFCTVVTGTSGGKAIDRREGMARAAAHLANRFIVTQDDPYFEDPAQIAAQLADPARALASHDTNPERDPQLGTLDVRVENQRGKAIQMAYDLARQALADPHANHQQVILVIGKGDEQWLEIRGKAMPWPADTVVVKALSEGKPNPALSLNY
jgi:UDP-N-acetylmuramoyl-L-alanyl-D-glutamate--2,6-diaminopimelate ligase